MTRALALQRQQIAALKALGYSNWQIAWHYIKWGLVIAGAGAVAGVVVGGWLGSSLATLYNEFFGFPRLDYHVSSLVAVASVVGTLAVAAAGIALLVIGYIGYFFGRMVQAAVSRQREFLADASAVQFTRNPQGLTGALKKIGG